MLGWNSLGTLTQCQFFGHGSILLRLLFNFTALCVERAYLFEANLNVVDQNTTHLQCFLSLVFLTTDKYPFCCCKHYL